MTSLKTISLTLATGVNGLVLEERPLGLYVDATEIAFRLNARESRTIELVATEFGAPKAGVKLGLALLIGTPASAITFPASVTTGANGRASVKIDAGNPGTPRGFIDGQVYQIGFFIAPAPISPSNFRGKVIVKIFDELAPVASPTWTANVEPIFKEFARLYPSMKARFDLSDLAQVKSRLVIIKAFMQMPQTDFSYMPVSRDLSKAKIDMIIKWIDAGGPL